jgi:hypothetical protein
MALGFIFDVDSMGNVTFRRGRDSRNGNTPSPRVTLASLRKAGYAPQLHSAWSASDPTREPIFVKEGRGHEPWSSIVR